MEKLVAACWSILYNQPRCGPAFSKVTTNKGVYSIIDIFDIVITALVDTGANISILGRKGL